MIMVILCITELSNWHWKKTKSLFKNERLYTQTIKVNIYTSKNRNAIGLYIVYTPWLQQIIYNHLFNNTNILVLFKIYIIVIYTF